MVKMRLGRRLEVGLLVVFLGVCCIWTTKVGAELPFVMLDLAIREPYTLEIKPDASMVINVGGQSFVVSTKFSSIAEYQWNYFGSSANGWEPLIEEITKEDFLIKACENEYMLKRRIKQYPLHIEVEDTFTNLTDEIIGIIFENVLTPINDENAIFRIAGLTAPDQSGTVAQRSDAPYVQVALTKSSVGMIAVDDVYRVHSSLFYRQKPKAVGIRDNMFGMAPGSQYTVRWSLYPTTKTDHFSFINRVRRIWGTNFLIPGPFTFVRPPEQMSEAEIRDFLEQTGIKIGSNVVGKKGGGEAFGSSYLESTQQRLAWEIGIDKYRAVDPNLKFLPYYDAWLDSSEGAKDKYPDSRVLLKDGSHMAFIYPEDSRLAGEKVYRFYPTKTNSFGQLQREVLSEVIKDSKGDGLYWDEMLRPSDLNVFMYDVPDWDGHTVDISPFTHKVKNKVTSAALVSLPWIDELVREIIDSEKTIYGNCMPITKTETDWRIPRFSEATNARTAPGIHLTSPLGLGIGDTTKPVIQMVHDFLNYGVLYVYHVGVYWNDSDIVSHIYPITPLELHEGYIIGKEKIITNRSGAFGWGDDKITGKVLIYGADGLLTERQGNLLAKDGLAFMEVDLNAGEVAVIFKH